MFRKARVTDVVGIHNVIKTFSEREIMLPMSIGQITNRLRDFVVEEVDREIVGTVAVHVTWETMVELRSLAVSKKAQGSGLGRELVEAALREARELGAENIFTLTYIPDFFKKFGFVDIDRNELPHKVWQDCTNCPKFPDCGEIALIKNLG